MRDHTRLRAFELADRLVLEVYKASKLFPKEEVFGLSAQIRRAVISIASNIVEGCARHTMADYIRFIDMAYGSAREVQYQLSLAIRLGYLDQKESESLNDLCDETCKVLNGLLCALRREGKENIG